MERNTPVRKPHTSTADLLTWSETPPPDSPAPPSSALRSHQVLFLFFISFSPPYFFVLFQFVLWFFWACEISALGWDQEGGVWRSGHRRRSGELKQTVRSTLFSLSLFPTTLIFWYFERTWFSIFPQNLSHNLFFFFSFLIVSLICN